MTPLVQATFVDENVKAAHMTNIVGAMFMFGVQNASLSYLPHLRENGVTLAPIPHSGHFRCTSILSTCGNGAGFSLERPRLTRSAWRCLSPTQRPRRPSGDACVNSTLAQPSRP